MPKTYIYIMSNINYPGTVKIGSSGNPLQRRETLQTALPNELKIERIYEILNYSAYSVDDYLKTLNFDNLPLPKNINMRRYISKGGGQEHYTLPNYDDLEEVFKFFQIKYKKIADYSIFKVAKLPPRSNILEMARFEKILQDKHYKLRDYQQKCIDLFIENLQQNKYFQGIYFLATGLGKTFIAANICLEHLKLYPNDNILWITYKNDIVDSQKKLLMRHNKFEICNHANFNINKLNTRGKVFIVLRQSLINKTIPANTINAIIYDECHDASKISTKFNNDIIDGKTYELLENLKKTQRLKYRIGFSATPLTEHNKQNVGIVNLYGDGEHINYLYKYSLIDGVINNWLLEPSINYIMTPHNIFKLDNKTINGIIKEIKYIAAKMVYKKGIIWFPRVNILKKYYKRLFIKNITISYSTSEYAANDKFFQEVEKNYIMLACEKFTTGFDGVNMEFGINLIQNESGHVSIQKLGRFTRKKPLQIKALFYQFCECYEDVYEGLVNSIIKNIDGMGANFDDIAAHIQIGGGHSQLLNIKKIFIDVQGSININFEQLKNKILLKKINGNDVAAIKKVINLHNKKIIESAGLIESITAGQLIDTRKKNKGIFN